MSVEPPPTWSTIVCSEYVVESAATACVAGHAVDRRVVVAVLDGIDPVRGEIERALLERRHLGGVSEVTHEIPEPDERSREDRDGHHRLDQRHPAACRGRALRAHQKPPGVHVAPSSRYQSVRPVVCVTLTPRKSVTSPRVDDT